MPMLHVYILIIQCLPELIVAVHRGKHIEKSNSTLHVKNAQKKSLKKSEKNLRFSPSGLL